MTRVATARALLAALAAADAQDVAPEEVAAAWQAVRDLMRARITERQSSAPDVASTAPDALDGGALVAAARSAGLLTLPDAHVLVDLASAARGERPATPIPELAARALAVVAGERGHAPSAAPATAPSAAPPSVSSPAAPAAGPAAAPAAAPLPRGDAAAAHVPAGAAAPDALPMPSRSPSSSVIVVGALVAVLAIVAGALLFARGRAGTSAEVPPTATTASPTDAPARAPSNDPDRPPALGDGIAAYARGDLGVARVALEAARAAAPASAEPLVYLGRIARDEGDLAAARRFLEEAVRLEPGRAVAHRELAAALLADGDDDLARRFYVRALALDADDRLAQGGLACALARLGRTDEAARWAERAGDGPWTACVQAAGSGVARAPLTTP